MILFGFALTAIYIPGIAGAATTSKWALLAVALPLMVRRPSSFTLAHLFGMAFLTWSTLSLLWTSNVYDGTHDLIKYAILAQAFLLGEQLDDLGSMFRGMAYGLLLSSAVVIAQLFYPDIVMHQTTHSGLYINSGTLAEIAALVIIGLLSHAGYGPCHSNNRIRLFSGLAGREVRLVHAGSETLAEISALVFVGLLSLCGGVEGHAERTRLRAGCAVPKGEHSGTHSGVRSRGILLGEIPDKSNSAGIKPGPHILLAIGLLPCILLPQSRGAWLGLAAAGIAFVWSRSKLSALALIALAAICITYSFHLGFHISSVTQRLGMWSDTVSGLTWLGHGIGSFWTDYAYLNTTMDTFVERPEHAHNDWLEVGFETGVVGFACCSLFVYIARPATGSVSGLILAGFAAEALVGFPLHNPATGFVAAMCLGHMARGLPDLRDVWSSWRVYVRGGLDEHQCPASDWRTAQGW